MALHTPFLSQPYVIPAQAGIQRPERILRYLTWIPAFAGMTWNACSRVLGNR
jgi:hypothetical protein